ncbi:WhiB family transcriptional regulator [Tamaricihabitans halophyticus]|uniref:WhiB family transcriptional regulator n=1 Tax=Tamaricihabitans halophyticus TaxID=1262583 RepID=UPI00140543E3
MRSRVVSTSTRIRSGWWRLAACRSDSGLDWYSADPVVQAECVRVCGGCPVRSDCLVEAMSSQDPWGIWGGVTPQQRESLAMRHGLPLPKVLPSHGTNARYAKHGCPCSDCRAAHATYERQRRARLR